MARNFDTPLDVGMTVDIVVPTAPLQQPAIGFQPSDVPLSACLWHSPIIARTVSFTDTHAYHFYGTAGAKGGVKADEREVGFRLQVVGGRGSGAAEGAEKVADAGALAVHEQVGAEEFGGEPDDEGDAECEDAEAKR